MRNNVLNMNANPPRGWVPIFAKSTDESDDYDYQSAIEAAVRNAGHVYLYSASGIECTVNPTRPIVLPDNIKFEVGANVKYNASTLSVPCITATGKSNISIVGDGKIVCSAAGAPSFTRIDGLYIDIRIIDDNGIVIEPTVVQSPTTKKYYFGPGGIFDIRRFGAKCDGRISYIGASTSGSSTISAADISLSDADTGKYWILTANDGSSVQRGQIASILSETSFKSSNNATVTVPSNGCLVFATDDYEAIDAACQAAKPTGGTVLVPEGITGMAHGLVVPGGVTLAGVGIDYNTIETTPARGSVLVNVAPATLGSTNFVQLGDEGTLNTSGNTTAQAYNIAIDAARGARTALRTFSRRARVERCQLWRGVTHTVDLSGQNSWFRFNIVGCANLGHGIYTPSGDIKILDNEVRQSGNNGHSIYLDDATNVLVRGNHTFKGVNGSMSSSYAGSSVYIDNSVTNDLHVIEGNLFDGTYGHHIVLRATGGRLGCVSLANNTFFQITGFPDATFSVIKIEPVGGSVRAVSIGNNTCKTLTGSSFNYKAFVEMESGATAWSNISVTGNTGLNVATPFLNFIPDGGMEGNIFASGSNTVGVPTGIVTKEVTITTAQMLALHATPISLVAAPGSGLALVFEGAEMSMDYNSAAYAGVDANDDLAIRYTNGSGAIVGAVEATGFIDQTSDQLRTCYPSSAVGTARAEVTPVANAALVLHMLNGEVTTGNSDLKVRIRYRVVSTI